MNKTPIEWTDFTVNPFRFRNLETGKVGHHCDKISPGCKNCYSSSMQAGPYLSGLTFIETNKPKGEFFLDEGVLQQVLRRKKPCRIFWEDMSDMFLADYPDEWIDRCFAVMALTPQHTHQVLTKRADRMRAWGGDCSRERFGKDTPSRIREQMCTLGGELARLRYPLRNAHLGVSVENQEYADKRIPDLLATRAAVRFVSYEPALGPVDFDAIPITVAPGFFGSPLSWHHRGHCHEMEGVPYPTLDQIIIGGESGPGARPFDLAWARNTIEQCKAAGVACFVKQLGGKPFYIHEGRTFPLSLKDRKGGDMSEWPVDLRVRQMPEVRA